MTAICPACKKFVLFGDLLKHDFACSLVIWVIKSGRVRGRQKEKTSEGESAEEISKRTANLKKTCGIGSKIFLDYWLFMYSVNPLLSKTKKKEKGNKDHVIFAGSQGFWVHQLFCAAPTLTHFLQNVSEEDATTYLRAVQLTL